MAKAASTPEKPLSYCEHSSGSCCGESPALGGQEGAGLLRGRLHPGAKGVDRVCAPSSHLELLSETGMQCSLGASFLPLTTIGPQNHNYQSVHSLESLLIVQPVQLPPSPSHSISQAWGC